MYAWLFKHILFPAYESGLRRRHTLKYLRDLEAQQWLSTEEIAELQWRKLMRLLRHAEAKVLFYRERFRKAGVTAAKINHPDDVRKLPPLTKDDIRANQEALLAEDVDPAALHASGTGGSTGEPLRFQYDHESYEWRIAGAARADRWAGWDWGRRQFYLWGAALQPVPWFTRVKKKLHNRLLGMNVVSSFDFTDAVLADYARRLNRYRPAVVVGYTNAVYEFARFCHERGLEMWSPKGVIPSAERLYDHQREMIGKVFRCGVFNRYGCREVMNIAAECDHHEGMHLNADNLYVELEADGAPAASGALGDVLVTDLNNFSMPFIRYRNGDLAVAASAPCSCGRGLPLLAQVEGRVLDMIVTPDGRYVPGEFFPHLLKDYAGIARYQVYQDKSYAVKVRLVPTASFDHAALADIERLIRRQLGPDVSLAFELVEEIPRTAGGKLRVTISEVAAKYGPKS